MSLAASAQDIGDKYSPDPLTALQNWAIYGGTIVGGFLIAIVFTALASRGGGPERYRPGRPWQHDEIWIGQRPEATEGERPRAAVPGSGGASGTW
jgi:hypothetical protein